MAFINRGSALVQKGEFDRAIADLNEAIRLDSREALAYHNRGWVWELLGQPDKAVADLITESHLHPKGLYLPMPDGKLPENLAKYSNAFVLPDDVVNSDSREHCECCGQDRRPGNRVCRRGQARRSREMAQTWPSATRMCSALSAVEGPEMLGDLVAAWSEAGGLRCRRQVADGGQCVARR